MFFSHETASSYSCYTDDCFLQLHRFFQVLVNLQKATIKFAKTECLLEEGKLSLPWKNVFRNSKGVFALHKQYLEEK